MANNKNKRQSYNGGNIVKTITSPATHLKNIFTSSKTGTHIKNILSGMRRFNRQK
jgi:hypothetical protein